MHTTLEFWKRECLHHTICSRKIIGPATAQQFQIGRSLGCPGNISKTERQLPFPCDLFTTCDPDKTLLGVLKRCSESFASTSDRLSPDLIFSPRFTVTLATADFVPAILKRGLRLSLSCPRLIRLGFSDTNKLDLAIGRNSRNRRVGVVGLSRLC